MSPGATTPSPFTPGPPPRRGTLKWLASEWGMMLVAIVLAFLIWAVVWNSIQEEPPPVKVEVRPDPRNPDAYAAFFPEGEVELLFRGPRGEVERAIRALGSPPAVFVDVPDNPEGTGHFVFVAGVDQYRFPFSPRLVKEVPEARIDVYRIVHKPVAVQKPTLLNVPSGYEYDIILEPEFLTLRGPSDALRAELRPDALDMEGEFTENRDPVAAPITRELTFAGWESEKDRLIRSVVDLPPAQAVIRFHESQTEEITNRFEWILPDTVRIEDFTITMSEADIGGNYTGAFTGRKEHLQRFAEAKDRWAFRAPLLESQLPEPGQQTDLSVTVTVWRDESLRDLQVHLTGNTVRAITIQRAPE